MHPLGGDTGSAFAGFQRSDEAPIPHIPDDIATHLIGEALTWVTRYAPVLLAAERTIFDSTLTADATSPSMRFRRRREAGRGLPLASPIVWQGRTYTALPDVRALLRLRGQLVYACYIVIASHTGMRASEIGAMQSDCLETVASLCCSFAHGCSKQPPRWTASKHAGWPDVTALATRCAWRCR